MMQVSRTSKDASASAGGGDRWARGPWLGLAALTGLFIAISAWLLFLHLRDQQGGLWGSGLALLTLLAASLILGSGLCLFGLRRDARRRRAESDVRQQRNILQSILDNLGDGVAVADEHGRLVLFNPAAERIVGLGAVDSGPEEWSEVYGLFRPDTVTPVPANELPLARAVAGKESRDVEMFVRNPNLRGGVFIRVTATPIKDARGAVKGGVAVFRDITERKWADAVLRDSEARFRSIVEATGSALIILSAEHRILEFNPEAERIYGRSRGEVLGQDYLELFVPKEFQDVVAGEILKVLAGTPSLGLETPIKAQDGTVRTLLWSISRLTSVGGQPSGAIATGYDITERKEAEEARRVRELARHLQSAREGERKQIAREIHDELGQALTGLKFQVSHLSRKLTDSEAEAREKLELVGRSIDGTIAAVRRIAAELRPQILDNLGLLEAIKWQAEQFQERTGISCSVELPGEEIDWSQEQSTAMFRIFQESLTNVARHAGAKHVAVRVSQDNGRVVLEVGDDGRGITEDERRDSRSFGLLGMHERARMFGGALSVDGDESKGTTVTLQMPCRPSR